MLTTGFFLALLVGVSLGLIGSGGSILTVPIMVYILGIDAVLATGYSLFVVGVTSFFGGIKDLGKQNTSLKTVLLFGIPSIITVYLTRAFLVPVIPETILKAGSFHFTKSIFLMVLFAVVMVAASLSMILPSKDYEKDNQDPKAGYNYIMILFVGSFVGGITGLVGAGGGFLIIPALVFFAKMPMKSAIGTSLLIISINSAIGFIGFLNSEHSAIDWNLLIKFTAISVVGIFIGIFFLRKISGEKLKTSFGWFVLLMGFYILAKELIL